MTNLVTLSEVKAYQGVTNTEGDAEINILIPKVSDLIKRYIGRSLIDFFIDEKVEVFNGGNPSIFLQEMPLNEVSSVELSSDYGKTYKALVEYQDFTIDRSSECLTVIASDRFPFYVNGYKVTYTGGYESTPGDIKLACMDLISYYQKAEMSVKSTRAAGANNAQIEYVMDTTLPSHIRRVLDMYRLDL